MSPVIYSCELGHRTDQQVEDSAPARLLHRLPSLNGVVLKDQQLKVFLTAFGLKQHSPVSLALLALETRQIDDLAERCWQCCSAW